MSGPSCRALVWGVLLLVWAGAAAAQDRVPGLGPAWSFSLSGSIQQRRDLVEHYLFTPTAALVPGTAGGWERGWGEQRTGVGLAYDLMAGECHLLQPRVGLGLSQAWFSAANNALGFSETWRTRPGLYWEAGGAAEIRSSPRRGPFLRLAYAWRAARLTEESESMSSRGPASGTDNRDSVFRWQEQEISLKAGWRLAAWTPYLGLVHSDWRLQKSLAYHIPETDARNPQELSLIRLLNGQESRYHYHNGRAWSPLLGLAWSPAPGWSLEISCRLAADPALGLSLETSF